MAIKLSREVVLGRQAASRAPNLRILPLHGKGGGPSAPQGEKPKQAPAAAWRPTSLEHKFSLTFGYEVAFLSRPDGLETCWVSVRAVRKPRSRRNSSRLSRSRVDLSSKTLPSRRRCSPSPRHIQYAKRYQTVGVKCFRSGTTLRQWS
jgi:hypothetical protein